MLLENKAISNPIYNWMVTLQESALCQIFFF